MTGPIELRKIRFDRVTRTCEGLVAFPDDPLEPEVPCALRFPVDPSPEAMREALVRQAREKRQPRAAGATSHLHADMAARHLPDTAPRPMRRRSA